MLVIEKDFVTTEPVREGCQINPQNYLPMYFFSVNSLTAAATGAKSLQSCPTLCDPIDGTTRLRRPWDSPSKNTGVGCHFLLQCMKVKSERVK